MLPSLAGVDAEMMDASGYISRRTLDAESMSSVTNVGAIIGGIIGGLACIALIMGAIFLWRRRSTPAFAQWTPDDNPLARNSQGFTDLGRDPYMMPQYRTP